MCANREREREEDRQDSHKRVVALHDVARVDEVAIVVDSVGVANKEVARHNASESDCCFKIGGRQDLQQLRRLHAVDEHEVVEKRHLEVDVTLDGLTGAHQRHVVFDLTRECVVNAIAKRRQHSNARSCPRRFLADDSGSAARRPGHAAHWRSAFANPCRVSLRSST